ncbi:hypothetical protein TRVL_02067 [Trypanosoma vivax]|nr:hypothetical protein TRVL_02067 [Trypanosoma vivax]
MPSPEMDEIDYHHWSFNPVHWVLIAKSYLTDLFFSVRPLRGGYSRVSMTNLAGERDQAACRREVCRAVRLIKEREAASVGIVNCVKNSLDAHGTMTPERPLRIHLVLFGFSRGGSTVFYTAMKLPPELASYVSLVVVEAPFDTLHNVINSSCWFPSFTLWFFRTFCDCSEDAYSFDPSRIHLRCPFAFIMSCVDTRVPNHLTRRLIDMVETQCPQIPAVEVLELQHSRHPLMPVGNRADQDAYVDFMERLYDTYCS